MGDKITSYNQRNGITAKNVNYGSGAIGDQLPPERRFKPWHFIAGAVGLVASVLGIIQFFAG